MSHPPAPLRLTLDGAALVDNWRTLARLGGRAACGAAVKANGYGLGAHEVVAKLAGAGCRDFFVATWAEAEALGPLPPGFNLSVLHGVRADDMGVALQSAARPVLNSLAQVARWKEADGGPCDVMVDTGMNRLGLSPEEARSGILKGMRIATLMSHLACADEPDHPLNAQQLFTFRTLQGFVKAQHYSLANSAGIGLGGRYAFNLTRPGIALYGGVPFPAMAADVRRVVRIEAEVLQLREVAPGQTVGYGGTFAVHEAMRLAILNIGYADGYLRCLAGAGGAFAGDVRCPLVGRVSMDLIAVDASRAEVGEGDMLEIDYDLPSAARASGLSQYELLTGLGRRYQRRWT